MLSDVYCAAVILKKICDHPLLLTKRAAEYLLEGMESMLNPEEAGVAERLAMYLADVAERTAFQEKHDNISCKLSFILSLLDNLISKGHNVLIFSQTRKMLNHIQESLSSNGLFLAAILGGETLNLSRVSFPFCYSIIIILSVACIHDCQFSYILIFVTRELRIACTMSQMERERGISPRLSPLAHHCFEVCCRMSSYRICFGALVPSVLLFGGGLVRGKLEGKHFVI